MSKIEITNSGPIEGTFAVDLSKGPGAYEFRGARGTGKTTCISSIDWLAGHKVDITLHDGELSGRIEGFGVVVPVGGKKRRKGEFELDTIDAEKFSLTDLVDPPGKTPEVRDAHAIKALAVLSEAKADVSLYYDLAGGQAAFDALGIQVTTDPVLLATRIKAAFDKLARERENTAEAERKHAAPLEHVPEDLDVNESSDLAELGSVRDKARDEFQRMKTERQNGMDREREIGAAKLRLETVRKEYNGPTTDEAASILSAALESEAVANEKIETLERELEKARVVAECATESRVAAGHTFEAAKSYASAVEELESIASQEVTYPDESAISEALTAVENSTQAYDRGVRIRDVKQNLAKATAHQDAAKAAEKAADEARNKAGQVFDILAQSLHTKHLQILPMDGSPRLFVEHPKRGRTAFDRVNGLSDGERVDYTLRELLPHIEAPGLLPIPQRIWQDLQPTDRKHLHELGAKEGLYLFGAQVDDGELRVVYLGDE